MFKFLFGCVVGFLLGITALSMFLCNSFDAAAYKCSGEVFMKREGFYCKTLLSTTRIDLTQEDYRKADEAKTH